MTKGELQKLIERWRVGAICREEICRSHISSRYNNYSVADSCRKETVIGLCWLPKDVCGYEGISVRKACAGDIEKRLGDYATLDIDQVYDLIDSYIETDKRVIG
ncbi:MAG: hypothetical protein LBB59_04830 [Campylobacteraceae bacterium]|jgi:hypothetical protein|nr:hypothetical protein [Campylobacteraceae bacterium]